MNYYKISKDNWSLTKRFDTLAEAQIGHEKWVNMFKNGNPSYLEDVSSASIKALYNGCEKERYYRTE